MDTTLVTSGQARLLGGRTAALLAVIAVVVGCGSTAPASTGDLPSRGELQPTARDYKRVYLTQPGGHETDRHVGYVAKEFLEIGRDETTITTVLDLSLTPIGFYFDDGGATYVYISDEKHDHLGNYEEQGSLEMLFKEPGIYRFDEEL